MRVSKEEHNEQAATSPTSTERVEKINGIDKWVVKCAMESLAQAESIKKDTKLMEAIGILAKERLEEMAHVIAHVDHATK
jgi:hypothetical protein